MLKLEKMKPYRIYKKKKFYLHDIKNEKRFGHLFILLSSDFNQNKALLNSPSINNRYMRSYFEEKRFIVPINTLKKRGVNDRKETYTTIKSETYVSKTFNKVEMYKGLNLYYGMSSQVSTFFNSIKLPPRRSAKFFLEYLKTIVDHEQFNEYKKKSIIVPIDDVEYSTSIVNHPLHAFLVMAWFEPDVLKSMFPNVNLFMVSQRTGIISRFDVGALDKKSLIKVKKAMKTIYKIDKRLNLDKDEKEVIDDVEVVDDNNEVASRTTNLISNTMLKSPSSAQMKFALHSHTDKQMESIDTIDKMEEIAEKVAKTSKAKNEDELIKELNTHEEFVQYTNRLKDETLVATRTRSQEARNEVIRSGHDKVEVGGTGKTLKDILADFEDKTIVKEDFNIKVNNEQMRGSTLKDFATNYNERMFEKDIIAIFDSLSKDKKHPLYVRKIDRVDSSDSFNRKETWRVELEGEDRTRHTFTIDVPTMLDDRFLLINGTRKIINHQMTLLPIVKTGSDMVRCVTNFGKTNLKRFGSKVSPKSEILKKFLRNTKNTKIKISMRDSTKDNIGSTTTLEYDNFASAYESISYSDTTIYFNQKSLWSDLSSLGIEESVVKSNQLCIGIRNDKPIILDIDERTIDGVEVEIVDYIIDGITSIDAKLAAEVEASQSSSRKGFMFSQLNILNRDVPLVFVLAYDSGLSKVMVRNNVKFEFSDKRKRLTPKEKTQWGMVEFKDGFLYYDLSDVGNSLLMNGLLMLPTKDYTYGSMDDKLSMNGLVEFIWSNQRAIKLLTSFTELFIDPITKDLCEHLKIPTDFTGFFLHANNMLDDNSHDSETDISVYRIRSQELIPSFLYKIVSRAYGIYSTSTNQNSAIKMSVPKDALLKEIQSCSIIENFSVSNPINESDSSSNATQMGPGGLNMSRAYSIDKRTYDPSFLGVFSPSTV